MEMKIFLLCLLVFDCSSLVRRSAEQKEPGLLPTTDDILQMGKNLLVRYPFEMVYSAINDYLYFITGTHELSKQSAQPLFFYKPNMDDMNYILKIKDQNISVPLSEPMKLRNLKEFNSTQPTVIMITGWTTNVNKPVNHALDLIYAAYRCRGNVNFLAIDTGRFIDTLYTWSAVNTEAIGKIIGESLENFIKWYPIEKIHIIGHSLGSHIAGSAGRYLKLKAGKTLSRITALDAASPCFNSETDLKGLTRFDADFVLVIHTNPGGLGKRDPIGDADFYPGGLHPHPPGCMTMVCSHLRAPEFYAESVYPGNEHNFLAVECGSILTLNTHYCSKTSYPMGYATPQNIGGIFFLNTNEESLYGMNATQDFKPLCNQ